MTERIGVTYLRVVSVLGGPAYHMAVFYDRGDGSRPRVIEFGPSNKSMGISAKSSAVSGDGRTSEFGHLATDGERPWSRRGVDPESNDSLRSQEIIKEGDDLSAQWAIIQGTADEAGVSRYAYLPRSQNSNTWAMEAIARAALPRPSGIATDINGDLNVYWAPGADRRLSTSQNGDITTQPMAYQYTPGLQATASPAAPFSASSPATSLGGDMAQNYSGVLSGAPSAPEWLLNPPDRTGTPARSGDRFGWPQPAAAVRDVISAPSPQVETDSDGYPTLWNGTPIPSALRPVAAWAVQTAPQSTPVDRGAPPVPSLQGPTDADGYPTLWNGVPIPPALRPLAAWAVRTGPQSQSLAETIPAAVPGQMLQAPASASGRQSRASLLPEELRPLARYFGLD